MNISLKFIIFALFSFSSLSQLIFPQINRDLEIDAVYEQINHTRTDIGAQKLHFFLSNPINELGTLQARQNIIAYIVEHNDLHAKLSILLNAFSKNEKQLEQILQPSTALEATFLENLYFSHDALQKYNHSPAYLELGQIAYLGNLCSSLIQHSLAFAIFTWGLDEEHTCAVHPPKKKHHHHDDNHACDHPSHSSNNIFKKLAQSKNFRHAFQLWHVISQVQELYSIQSVVRQHLTRITTIQDQLIGVANSIRTLKKFHVLLEEHPEVSKNLTHYPDLQNICCSTNISPNLEKLLQYLATKTFATQSSVFSRIGIILAAYKLIQEVGIELQPALQAIAELDAYVNCAELVKDHQSGPLRYCFASYHHNSNTPLLEAYNFWHPLMQGPTIALNSISLGAENNPRNIILTGPNASGKSTSLKAIILCAYLAQTLTIVPAEKYSQTIYEELYSSMIVSDNIRKNMSLFVTEINDAQDLLARVNNLKENEYMLIALDELFKSTNHERGPAVAYNLLQQLYACPQVITVTSTHFTELSALADEENNRCANYTLDRFKLIPGINSDNSFETIKEYVASNLI